MPAAKTATPKAPTADLNIYQIIAKISEEAGALAPTKADGSGLAFAFRGVDAVVAHLTPFLNKYGVIIVPEVLDRETTARELVNRDGTLNGKAITQTDLRTAFTFYAPDGSNVTATTHGLAQDYADRSAAQAQSVAFRVALLQTFHLPTHDKEPEVAGEETQRYLEKTAEADTTNAPPKETIDSVRAEIGALIGDAEKPQITPEKANEIMADVTKGKESDKWTLTDLKKGRDALKAL